MAPSAAPPWAPLARRTQVKQAWPSAPGAYVVVRDGAVIAWCVTEGAGATTPFRILGAHTDSPCLRLKPQPELHRNGYWQLGVEVYGGALLAPWFDRDLSLAGRVTYSRDGRIESQLRGRGLSPWFGLQVGNGLGQRIEFVLHIGCYRWLTSAQ